VLTEAPEGRRYCVGVGAIGEPPDSEASEHEDTEPQPRKGYGVQD
jgi:hypothetical protein